LLQETIGGGEEAPDIHQKQKTSQKERNLHSPGEGKKKTTKKKTSRARGSARKTSEGGKKRGFHPL